MLKPRTELEHEITKLCQQNIGNQLQIQFIIDGMLNEANIPISITSSVLTLRTLPSEVSEFILYYLAKYLAGDSFTKQFFTKEEIVAFTSTKYEVKKIKFPIRWSMIAIDDYQWIGKIDAKELMMLRNAQLINYNENAQRTLKRMIVGGEECWQIALNKTAVNSIIDSFKTNSYIPNTITLNLPEEAEFEYVDNTLVIKSTPHFDILDGYHRYVAISNLYNMDRNFNYTMELRVVAFADAKAKQFIWQEDQKTKMAKIDSEALNKNNYGTQIIAMLIQKDLYFEDKIMRNRGVIDESVLNKLINILFIKPMSKYDRKQLISIRDVILDAFHIIMSQDEYFFEKNIPIKLLICTMYLIKENNVSVDNIKRFNLVVPDSALNGRSVTHSIVNRFRKIYAEVFADV